MRSQPCRVSAAEATERGREVLGYLKLAKGLNPKTCAGILYLHSEPVGPRDRVFRVENSTVKRCGADAAQSLATTLQSTLRLRQSIRPGRSRLVTCCRRRRWTSALQVADVRAKIERAAKMEIFPCQSRS
jgi:hypothetical protein